MKNQVLDFELAVGDVVELYEWDTGRHIGFGMCSERVSVAQASGVVDRDGRDPGVTTFRVPLVGTGETVLTCDYRCERSQTLPTRVAS